MNYPTRESQLETALANLWRFASGLVEKHGEDGDASMTDAEHATWQNAAGAANHLLGKVTDPVPVVTIAAQAADAAEVDPYAQCLEAGYTVHAPTDICRKWAFCIEGDYVEGFDSWKHAWDGALLDMVAQHPELAQGFDPDADPYADCKAAGYTVHSPDMDCPTWSFCVGNKCVDGFDYEKEAWAGALKNLRRTSKRSH
jgi:hypothetical protein